MAAATIVCSLNASLGLNSAVSTSASPGTSIGFASAVPVASRRSRTSAFKAANIAKPLSFNGALVFNPLVIRSAPGKSKSAVRSRNARAEASSEQPEKENEIAPLVPESPSGQFLVSILQSHPHLFPAAADQQLERLAADRDAALLDEQQNSSSTELTLYKRIKEVKEDERRKSLEEVMYALIVQKFVEGGITLVPKIPTVSDGNVKQIGSVSQDKELEAVHSAEALEMVREHLTVVLGGRGTSTFLDQHTIANISKLRVGQVYAASIMYGYFLRRVDQRFQLEKTMKGMLGAGEALETEPTEQTESTFQLTDDDRPAESGIDSLAAEAAAAIASFQAAQTVEGGQPGGAVNNAVPPGMKPSKLRSYVMSFDPETLQNCATMKARESLNVIERQAEALFGKPEIKIGPNGTFKVVSDDTVKVSFSELRRLVLEAVAFGSYLWDVETFVDSQYNLIRH